MTGYRQAGAIRTVAVIGSGVIGAGWTAAFLGAGLEVRLFDPATDSARHTNAHVNHAWPQMVMLGRASQGDDWQARLTIAASLEDAARSADYVQENTPEQLHPKQELIERLDALAPAEVIIASSTSSFAITELQAACRHPGRIVLGHPFNPVHLMPLVEIGGGALTDPAAIGAAADFYTRLGKSPIKLRKEVFGHIANRLASALFREAVSLVAEDVASVSDIDMALSLGPALKWAIQGQFTSFHTTGGEGGLADFLAKFSPGVVRRWESMSTPDLLDPGLQAKLVGQMAELAGQRSVAEVAEAQDRKLLAILRLLAENPET